MSGFGLTIRWTRSVYIRTINFGDNKITIETWVYYPDQISNALSLIKDRSHILFEASGNINKKNLLAYAKSGVDIISTSSTILNPHKKMDYSLKLL